jgi:PAS domain S-box-containing protein
MSNLPNHLAVSRHSAAQLDELVQASINQVLFQNLPFYIPANFVLSLVFAYLHRSVVASTVILAWLALVLVISLLRFAKWYAFQNPHQHAKRSERFWLLAFRFGSLFSGLCWGLGGYLMFAADQPLLLASLVTILGGVSAASALAVGIDRTTALVFAIPAPLPALILLISQGGQFPWLMAALLVLLIALTLNSSSRSQKVLREITTLRLESLAKNEQLKISQQRLEQAQGMAKMGSWRHVIGQSKNLIHCSPEIYRLFGMEPGETARNLFSARVHSEDQLRVQEAFNRAADTGDGYEIDYRIWHPDRGERYLHEVVRVELDADQHPSALFGVTQDVTERTAADHELQRLALVAQKTSSAVLITDHKRRIEWVNPAFERLTGYSLAECHARHAGHLLQGKDTDPETVAQMHQALSAGQSFDVELLNYHKTGKPYWVHLKVDPVFDAEQKLVRFIGVQSDISEFKMLENQLRQSQKMQVVGQLAGGIAHDFNNNLTAMMMSLDLLHADPALGINARQTLNELDEMMQRAAKITAQLLMFARRQTVQMQRLDLNQLLDNLHSMLLRLLGSEIDLQLLRYSEPLLIDGDHGLIDQAIINLAVNARDAMPQGGKLQIELSVVALSEADAKLSTDARAGTFARVSVRDSGTGIKPSDIAHIFEPFFTTKDVGKGTGLGLASVHGLMHQHKGWVSVHSELGRGASFRLYFPLADAISLATPIARTAIAEKLLETSPSNALTGNETVLLVEDEPNVRQGCVRMLERLGYQVIASANGHDGYDQFLRHAESIRVVITDMVMPGAMNGLQLSQKIRQTHSALPIILMSGHSVDIMQARMHEMDDQQLQSLELLAKPFEIKQLIALIRQKLDLAPSPQPIAPSEPEKP